MIKENPKPLMWRDKYMSHTVGEELNRIYNKYKKPVVYRAQIMLAIIPPYSMTFNTNLERTE